MNYLEICTDASIRTYPNGRTFGCSGTMCINNAEQYNLIFQDTTNNRAELLAIYIGIKLGEKIMKENPGLYDGIILYSDSQFGIFGLTKWMDGWMKNRDSNGVMYGSNRKPVKNQDLFVCILSYIALNQIPVKFLHCSGHVRYTSCKNLVKANETFNKANGFYLRPEDIYKISYYNDIVDRNTKAVLEDIDPDAYSIIPPVQDYSQFMRECIIPPYYKQFIL